jgi:hypothetical protein
MPESAANRGLLCHLAFWCSPLFATPLFIALHNPEDVVLPLHWLVACAGGAWLLVSALGWRLAALARPRTRWWLNRILLACALVTAVQGNLVHELFDYGTFNGERVDLRAHGWAFWLEWLAWLTALPIAVWLLGRLSRLPAWLAVLPVVSCALLLWPALQQAPTVERHALPAAMVDSGVFEFSRRRNLVHLLPDGLQGDIVRQVFEQLPDLAARFRGFTLFTDHVGMYPGTAPALYTILTGRPFPLDEGWDPNRVAADYQQDAYPISLKEAGFRLDYVPISAYICAEQADSCHVRPFNDMKARGYERERVTDAIYQLRLLADLTLFRLFPMFLKEQVYNDGAWLFADTRLDGASPYPDPILRDWAAQLRVVEAPPVYKWYHYVGAHMPAYWDADCRRQSEPGIRREDYLAQTECVLRGIAELLIALEQAGIYDQTALLISGDHGVDQSPDDLTAPSLNGGMYPGLMGYARPALLAKRVGDRAPLRFSDRPTHLRDIAATALDLAGLGSSSGTSAYAVPGNGERQRRFLHYAVPEFFSTRPVPWLEYAVGQPARDGARWRIAGIHDDRPAPAGYDPLNRATGKGYVVGARLRKSFGNNKASWITGRQLAFVIGLPDPLPDPVSGRRLALTLHLPDWIPRQSLTLRFNGGPPRRSLVLHADPEQHWQRVELDLPADLQRPGRNFVDLEFSELATARAGETGPVAALLRSIEVLEASAPQSAPHQ